MIRFMFKGVITKFGTVMSSIITMETMAPSKAKAKSNFIAQAKKRMNLSYSAGGINVVGEITEIDEEL